MIRMPVRRRLAALLLAVTTVVAVTVTAAAPAAASTPVTGRAEINFGDTGVTGWAEVSLNGDGAYRFAGHFHNAGSFDFESGIAWIVRASDGTAFVFTEQGLTDGTSGTGSHDYDWSHSGVNPRIQAAWTAMRQGYRWQWRASTTSGVLSMSGMLETLESDVGGVTTVVGVVGDLDRLR